MTMLAQPEDHRSSTFRYTFKSGQTLVLPSFASLMTFGMARKLRALPEDEQVFALIEQTCDESALSVLDQMDLTETQEFFSAWQAGSQVRLGESSGSSS